MPSRRSPRHRDYPDGCVVAYVRVSTAEQAESGAGLDAQRAAITAYADRAGLTISRWCADEGVSGSVAPLDRPGLSSALAVLAACKSGALLVAKSDRVARKLSDLLALRDLAEREGWTFSAADGSVDNATPYGRAMTSMSGTFAELERDLIRARTREALAARKADGVRLGRPSKVPDDVRQRIATERASGATLTAIADGLTADGVPTVGNGAARPGAVARTGARWYPSTVSAVLRSIDLDRDAADRKRTNEGN